MYWDVQENKERVEKGKEAKDGEKENEEDAEGGGG